MPFQNLEKLIDNFANEQARKNNFEVLLLYYLFLYLAIKYSNVLCSYYRYFIFQLRRRILVCCSRLTYIQLCHWATHQIKITSKVDVVDNQKSYFQLHLICQKPFSGFEVYLEKHLNNPPPLYFYTQGIKKINKPRICLSYRAYILLWRNSTLQFLHFFQVS